MAAWGSGARLLAAHLRLGAGSVARGLGARDVLARQWPGTGDLAARGLGAGGLVAHKWLGARDVAQVPPASPKQPPFALRVHQISANCTREAWTMEFGSPAVWQPRGREPGIWWPARSTDQGIWPGGWEPMISWPARGWEQGIFQPRGLEPGACLPHQGLGTWELATQGGEPVILRPTRGLEQGIFIEFQPRDWGHGVWQPGGREPGFWRPT